MVLFCVVVLFNVLVCVSDLILYLVHVCALICLVVLVHSSGLCLALVLVKGRFVSTLVNSLPDLAVQYFHKLGARIWKFSLPHKLDSILFYTKCMCTLRDGL